MSNVQGPEVLTPQDARRTQPPEGTPPPVPTESINKIDKAEREILNFQRKASRQEIDNLDIANARAAVDPAVKQGLREVTAKANEVRSSLNKFEGRLPEDMIPEAQEVTKSVTVFLRAAEEELIIVPEDVPTFYLYKSLVAKLHEQGATDRTAPSLHLLISGILNEPQYMRFSGEGEAPTKLERDLAEMLRNPGWPGSEYFLNDLFIQILNEHGEDAIPNMTRDQIRAKIAAIKENALRTNTEEKDRQRREAKEANRQEETYLINAIQEDEDTDEGRKTMELYQAFSSPRSFFDFYKRNYEEQFNALSETANPNHVTDPAKRKERAAKNVTEDIQKRIQFMMYRIYAQVLNGDPRKAFNESVQAASGLYGSNPSAIYNWLKKKVIRVKADLEKSEAMFAAEGGDMPFYMFGNEEKEIFVKSKNPSDTKTHRFIRESVVSSELKRSTFLGFIENLHISMDAENDLLQAGINFNHLMLTGKLDQGQHSFFHQAAVYAEAYLPTPRLDELYKLPYHEIVEAAKIALSGFYKKEFAKIGWKRNPELNQGMFESLDRVQHELLHDMVHNFADADPPVPAWAIKRAIIHARMHLSLVNLEMHALSSYAHAPISDLNNPTFRDPALKNLETFKTWYATEQWRVSDTSLKGMAFMPSPSASWQHKDWYHEQVTAEGEEIAEQSLHIGKLARVDRHYFNWDTAPNVMELNPMKMGGLEIQRGFRLRYPAMPWLTDLMDQLNDEEQLKLDKGPTVITEGWKRLENIGINVLKMYRDDFMLGSGNEHIKLDSNGNLVHEAHLKDFFGYMYRRYFSEGVGKQSLSLTVPDGKYETTDIKLSQIQNESDFWEKVVNPILTKPIVQGKGESLKGAAARNMKQRVQLIKNVVNNALTVMAFERMPMDFLTVEDPSRSQNGITLMGEIQQKWIKDSFDPDAKPDPHGHGVNDKNTHQIHELETAMNDLIYVQQYARIESVKQMNSFVKSQNDHNSTVRNLFTKDENAIKNRDRSDIDLSGGKSEKKGYVINEEVIRHILEKRDAGHGGHGGHESHAGHGGHDRIENAVKLYNDILTRIVDKPTENRHELDPEVSNARLLVKMKERGLNYEDKSERDHFAAKYKEELKQKFREARENNMITRLAWSGDELLSDKTVFCMNDMAYQFLEFVRAGEGMVERSIHAIANTQDAYKHFITATDDHGLLSALKKYYRKEDHHDLHHGIVEMRNHIKEEDGDTADRMAYEVLLNSINVMRINSDAEDNAIELAYQASHRKRSAFSVVVHEGEEHPLRREERQTIVEEFLHTAQFPKRKNIDKGEGEYVYKPTTFKKFTENFGEIGEQVAEFAETYFGIKSGKLIRQKFDEISGEGMRSREVASFYHILWRYGGTTLLALGAIAALILFISSTYIDESGGGGGGGGGGHH